MMLMITMALSMIYAYSIFLAGYYPVSLFKSNVSLLIIVFHLMFYGH